MAKIKYVRAVPVHNDVAVVANAAVGVGIARFGDDVAFLALPVEGILASEHGEALPLVGNHPPVVLPEEYARAFAAAYTLKQPVVLPVVQVAAVGAGD